MSSATEPTIATATPRDPILIRSTPSRARGELANATWEGIVGVADGLDAAVTVIGSRA